MPVDSVFVTYAVLAVLADDDPAGSAAARLRVLDERSLPVGDTLYVAADPVNCVKSAGFGSTPDAVFT